MGYLDYIGLVIKDIKNRKFSAFLTLLAISLGILSIFVIVLVGEGFQTSIEKQFEQLGGNKLYISSEASGFSSGVFTRGLTDNEVIMVENKPFVEKAYPYYFKVAQMEYSREFKSLNVMGTTIDDEFFQEFNIDVEKGRIPKSNEKFSIVMGPIAAEETFDKEIVVGSNVYLEGYKFKVVGILESLGNPDDDKNVYFDIDTLRDIYEAEDNVGFIYANCIFS
jgi:putative ABC transport system permease protein